VTDVTAATAAREPVDVNARLRVASARPLGRLASVAALAVRMMVHDKAKFLGTLLGVVFAVVLANQQLGILIGLLDKNTMFVDHAGADLWIVPPNTTTAQPGQRMSTQLLYQALATPGVKRASALVMIGAAITKPGGGSEGVTLVGVDLTTMLGGPWNIIAGDPSVMREPSTLLIEDSLRAKFGGLNLGSLREINGYQVRIGGFVWGLQPFGPPYTFTDIDTARSIGGVASDELNFVLVQVAPGGDADAVARELAARCPTADIYSRDDFHRRIVIQLLRDQLGVSFGTSTAFGLIIGFIIVALLMFSSVLDRVREFATLKALGLTDGDLTRMLLVQSVCYSLLGSLIGLGVVGFMAKGISSANLAVIVPHWLVEITPVVMLGLCAAASLIAVRRVRKLEPGMVFR
jgi:putative ABC transport system permease protein